MKKVDKQGRLEFIADEHATLVRHLLRLRASSPERPNVIDFSYRKQLLELQEDIELLESEFMRLRAVPED